MLVGEPPFQHKQSEAKLYASIMRNEQTAYLKRVASEPARAAVRAFMMTKPAERISCAAALEQLPWLQPTEPVDASAHAGAAAAAAAAGAAVVADGRAKALPAATAKRRVRTNKERRKSGEVGGGLTAVARLTVDVGDRGAAAAGDDDVTAVAGACVQGGAAAAKSPLGRSPATKQKQRSIFITKLVDAIGRARA